MRKTLFTIASGIAAALFFGCGGGSGGGTTGTQNAATIEVRALSAGWHHTCAIILTDRNQTEVKCWGGNNHGELGNDTLSDSRTPVTVLDGNGQPLRGVKEISASRYYTCALLDSGHVKCWGWNEGGKLGDGKMDKTQFSSYRSYIPFEDEANAAKAVDVLIDANTPLDNVVQISAGSWHACALLNDGTVKCWGQNFDGALGIGKNPDEFDPQTALINHDEFKKLFWPYAITVVESNTSSTHITDVKQVAAGSSDHTCILFNDGKVKCWAWNGGADGELGFDDTSITFTTAPSQYVKDETGNELTGVSKIVTGGDFTCALLSSGGVKCWGWNPQGQLGNDLNESVAHAVTVMDQNGSPLSGVKDIVSERGNHTCALMNDDTLKCWGDNTHGQLGIGNIGSSYIAHAVDVGISDIKSVAAGGGGRDPLSSSPVQYDGDHTCAITVAGEVYCWGSNDKGQLGDGTTQDRASPVKVQGL